MDDVLRDVGLAGGYVFAVGLVLWPPRAVYWSWLAERIGSGITLVIVGLLAVVLGAAFLRATTVPISALLVGGVGAYLVGMIAIAVAFDPDSPVHLVLYGGILVCVVIGGAANRYTEATEDSEVPTP